MPAFLAEKCHFAASARKGELEESKTQEAHYTCFCFHSRKPDSRGCDGAGCLNFPLTPSQKPWRYQSLSCCTPSSFMMPGPFHSFERTRGLWMEFQTTEKCQVQTHSQEASTFIMCAATPGKQGSSVDTFDKGYIMV